MKAVTTTTAYTNTSQNVKCVILQKTHFLRLLLDSRMITLEVVYSYRSSANANYVSKLAVC